MSPTATIDSADTPNSIAVLAALESLAMARAAISSPEFRLLLLCGGPRDGFKSRLKGLEQPLNWDLTIELARHHGMMPLLAERLQDDPTGDLPGAVRSQLQAALRSNLQRNLVFSSELLFLLDHLAKAGIFAIPYKGPVLAEQLYDSPGMRVICDLDLLVQKKDVAGAEQLFHDLGFKGKYAMDAGQYALRLSHGNDLTFTRRGLTVEMHWRLLPDYFSLSLDCETIWQRLHAMTFADSAVLTLAPEDLLLALILHGSKHFWSRLIWLCDVAELIRRSNPDWSLLLQRAQPAGAERIVLLAALLCHRLLATDLPEWLLLRAQKDGAINRLERMVCRHLPESREATSPAFATYCFLFLARERWRDRARFVFRHALTPGVSEWAAISVPGYLSFIYLPLRLFRLIRRGCNAIGDRWRSPVQASSSPS